MSKLVNLTRFRKQKARAEKRRIADGNAVRHGMTKAETTLIRARTDKAERALDGHRTQNAGAGEPDASEPG